jgi:hypothetical protein
MNIEIRKSISRKINTGQYENIVITCELQGNSVVENDADLYKLQKEITDKLIKDYVITENAVLEELELQEKKAFMESPSTADNKVKLSLTPEQESELFG